MYVEAITHIEGSALKWDTEGYYPFGSDSWKDSTITATMTYKSGRIGVIPRFDSDISYVIFTVENINSSSSDTYLPTTTSCVASLDAFIGNKKTRLAGKELTTPLVEDTEYIIKTVISRTNYKVYFNNTLLFNVEYNGLNNGSGAVYATEDNLCTDIEVEESIPSGWTTNADIVSGGIYSLKELPNKDKYIYLQNPSSTSLYIEQEVSVVADQNYTISFSYLGELRVQIIPRNGTGSANTPLVLTPTETWTDVRYTIHIPEECTLAAIRFIVDQDEEASINDIQFELGSQKTSYIHNNSLTETASRGDSFVTYPAKNNIVETVGTLSVWVKPYTGEGTIMNYGEDMGITFYCSQGNVFLGYDSTYLSVDGTLKVGEWNHIAGIWRADRIALYVNGEKQEHFGIHELHEGGDLIRVGHAYDNTEIFDGVIDDLIIFSKDLSEDDILAIYASATATPNTEQMLFRATFDHAIGNFNKSVIEMTPAPMYGSPVIVEKQDGTSMRKVSFFDPDTGEYRTYNQEQVIYDGYSDFVRVAYKDLDTDNYKIKVQDYTGAQYGDPYRIEGNKIYLTLSADSKKLLKNQALWVSYQPENAFTLDYNIGMPDSFRATIGKYDGQPLTITYEGNRYSTEKLATMIELNPLLNPNHEGFMYITQAKQEVSVFRVKATPSDLAADGVSEAIIVIEPLDSNGNFISNAKLEVTTEITNSSVLPNYDAGSIMLRERAGRYLYRYRTPLMQLSEYKQAEVTDYVNVKDKVSGIGVQIPITLTLRNTYPNTIQMPSLEEENWELVASRLLSAVMDYFQVDISKLPDGLGDILDFDGDGKIDLNEIIWINTYKVTQTLYNKYIEYLSWQALNE